MKVHHALLVSGGWLVACGEGELGGAGGAPSGDTGSTVAAGTSTGRTSSAPASGSVVSGSGVSNTTGAGPAGSTVAATTTGAGGAPDTALGVLAFSMAPGTWAELQVPNQNEILGVGSISGTMLHYCNEMPWNPFSRAIEIVGQDHGYPALRHARYLADQNTFELVADDAGIGSGHGYDHNAVNPFTGDLYSRLYGGFSGHIDVSMKPFGAAAYQSIPSVDGLEQVAIGSTWWSGPFGNAGAQGVYMIFNSGNANGGENDGQIVAYDPVAGAWIYNEAARSPFYGSGSTYHSVIAYSAVHNVAVYGGGNVASRKLWRIDASGSVLAMPDVPAGKGVGIQQGNLVADPASGSFLLLSAGELWALDPTGSGTWTQQTGMAAPPDGVGIPGGGYSSPVAVISSSIPDYGVVVYVTQPSSNGATFWVYKHG